MEFYLINCQPQVLETIRRMPPLEGFNHSFLDSAEPRKDLLARADVILVVPASGADGVRALAQERKASAQLILLADKEQTAALGDSLALAPSALPGLDGLLRHAGLPGLHHDPLRLNARGIILFHVPDIGVTLALHLFLRFVHRGAEGGIHLLMDAVLVLKPDQAGRTVNGGLQILAGLPQVQTLLLTLGSWRTSSPPWTAA